MTENGTSGIGRHQAGFALSTLWIAGVFASSLTCSLAAAQDNSFQGMTLVNAKGSCTSFIVDGQSYACKGVIYTHFKNGRTAWQIPIPDGVLMLSGGSDSQPDPTKYVLQIDTLRIGKGDGSGQNLHAKGVCTSNVSEDGKYLHSLTCSATGGGKNVQVEFKGDGSSVDIKKL